MIFLSLISSLSGSVGKLINDANDILVGYLEKLQKWPELNMFYKMLLEERQASSFIFL